MNSVRPMLAASFDNPQNIEPELVFLDYPLLVSPKIDGIRFLAIDGSAISRSGKPLPNQHLQAFFKGMPELNGLDGEITIGRDPCQPDMFNKTQSAIMTRGGEPNFCLHVFDMWDRTTSPFSERTIIAADIVAEIAENQVVTYLQHYEVNSPLQVAEYEEAALEAGYEGIMLRSPSGTYKYGRSTLKRQGLIKVKRFLDDDATVVGFEPLERNLNEPTKDAFGLQKRSSHRANKVVDALLGKLLVENDKWGQFAIGSGFDVATRETIWQDQPTYLGRTVTFKYQPHGVKDKPRMPIFKGFRPELD